MTLFDKRNRHRFDPRSLAFGAAVAALFAATIASAATTVPGSSLPGVEIPTAADFVDGTYGCTIPHVALLEERRQRIADAPTVEEARSLALTPARAARRALQFAGLVAPSTGKIAQARADLETYEARVEEGETPAVVAGEFGRLLNLDIQGEMQGGGLLQVADLNVQNANVRAGDCHYSTGEVIAIVFGFILFIIPGIILLGVLC